MTRSDPASRAGRRVVPVTGRSATERHAGRHDAFLSPVPGLPEFLFPAYVEARRTHLLTGFGCAAGQHRAVAMTKTVSKALAEDGWQVSKRRGKLEWRGRGTGVHANMGTGA